MDSITKSIMNHLATTWLLIEKIAERKTRHPFGCRVKFGGERGT